MEKPPHEDAPAVDAAVNGPAGALSPGPGPADARRRHLFSASRPAEFAMVCLLLFFPAALAARAAGADAALTFILGAVAVVPLSAVLGRATEEYAIHAGPALGGLLNATLGNAVELIIAMFAVTAGLFEIVKASLTGSIIANLLLVLGASLLAGGLKHKTLVLHRRATATTLSLMTLSVIALALPALFFWASATPGLFSGGTHAAPTVTAAEAHARLETLSLITAAVMIAVYVLSLVYSLVTHRHLFHEKVAEEQAEWSKRRALLVMGLATAGVAVIAELLVGSVEGLRASMGWNELFVGVVVVAIVGNAAEHSTAILVALKGKMDLAFQIAAGSSAQIALFVAPVLVFFAAAIGHSMALDFEVFELFSIILAVAVAYAVSIDEETNWFEGAMLLGVYAIICAVFFLHV
jgi:Ca2+:H+ antiporter